MNSASPIHIFWRSIRDAAWAPLLVILFRAFAISIGVRQQFDHFIHFSGGFAIAYFLYRVIKIADAYIGGVTPLTRYLLAFTSACTVAVFWEIAEFALDIFTGSHIQHKVSETLYDLIFGVAGAVTSLALIAIISILQKRQEQSNSLH